MTFRLALLNLTRNMRRTLAVLLTVALGSGSLFVFHGFNFGIMNQYRENTVHSRYGHGQVNTLGYRDLVYEKPWEHWIGGWSAVATQLKEIPGVKQIFPRIGFYGLLTNGQISVSGRGQGVDGLEESKFFTNLNIEEGVALSDQPDGMVLGKGLARSLDVKVGGRVTVLVNTVNGTMNGGDFTVVGVFHTGAKEFDDAVFRIPLAQTFKLLDTDRVESIAIGLNDEKDWGNVVTSLKSHWPELEATPFAVLDKVYYQNSVDWLKSQFGVIQVIILTIVVLGIFNTISTGVLERKSEIGNLRANGESVRDVLSLLSLEGLALGLIGSGCGLLIAWLFNVIFLKNGILMPPAPGLTRQYHVFIEFEPMMGLWAVLMSSFTALVATIVASNRVARLPIAEALRSV
ncbi:MAG: ABC transporter permease [Bdellovibrio sp.]|nr:ABC transporter permease [Bdellovibrio sp.]